jgi:hypothetical protein
MLSSHPRLSLASNIFPFSFLDWEVLILYHRSCVPYAPHILSFMIWLPYLCSVNSTDYQASRYITCSSSPSDKHIVYSESIFVVRGKVVAVLNYWSTAILRRMGTGCIDPFILNFVTRWKLQSISLPDRTYTHKWRYRQIEIKIK